MSRLSQLYDEKQEQAGPPPDPLGMGVRPPRRLGFVDIAEWNQKIRATRRKANRLLRKYAGGI